MGLVVIMGLVITGIYAFTNKVLLKDPNVKLPTGTKKKVRHTSLCDVLMVWFWKKLEVLELRWTVVFLEI